MTLTAKILFELYENYYFTIDYTDIVAISPKFVCGGGGVMAVDYINLKNKMVADRKQKSRLTFA